MIKLPSFDVHARVEVAVQVGAEQAANTSLLTEAVGRFARLRRARDIINREAYPLWFPDSLIDAVQTSRRVELNPASALDELRRFWTNQEKVMRATLPRSKLTAASKTVPWDRSRAQRSARKRTLQSRGKSAFYRLVESIALNTWPSSLFLFFGGGIM